MTSQQSTITRKGQITVPASLRRRLGLAEGDRVEFEAQDDALIVRRATSVAERTAGMMSGYAREAPLTPDQERAAFEQAVADEVSASLAER